MFMKSYWFSTHLQCIWATIWSWRKYYILKNKPANGESLHFFPIRYWFSFINFRWLITFQSINHLVYFIWSWPKLKPKRKEWPWKIYLKMRIHANFSKDPNGGEVKYTVWKKVCTTFWNLQKLKWFCHEIWPDFNNLKF